MKTSKTLHAIIQPMLGCFAVLVFNLSVIQSVVAQSFNSTGIMTTTRENHTATLLPDGTVLVAGGITDADAGGVILSSTENYDPIIGTWTSTATMKNARNHHTATLLPSGKVLVAGGGGVNGVLSFVELYDPNTGKWTPTNSLNTARAVHTATLLPNGQVLVTGGTLDGSKPISSTELFNPVTGKWTPINSLKIARVGHTATLLPNGKVLVAGGSTAARHGASISSSELYDPATGNWTITGSMTTVRSQASAILLSNGKVLMVAGSLGVWDSNGNGIDTNSAELYDPATGVWTKTGSLTTGARHGQTATLLSNGTVLMAGGGDNPLLTSAEIYDPTAALWTAANSMNAAREWQTATLLTNGSLLIAGGCGVGEGSPAIASAEIYNSTLVPLALNTTFLPNGTAPTAYYEMLDATGGMPPYSWTSTSGSLPPGLTLAASGLISGQPTTVGNFNLNMQVTDALSHTVIQTLMLEVVWVPDPNKPTLTITNPITTGGKWSNVVLAVAGTAKDTIAVTNVLYSLNGGTWSSALSTNNWSNWTAVVTLIPGTNTIAAYAVNPGGNSSTVVNTSVFFVVTNQLQIHAVGLGSISPNYSNAWLNIGQNYSLTSSPASGFLASNWVISTNWVGGMATNSKVVHFTMTSNLTLQVNFVDTNKPFVNITNMPSGLTVSNAAFTVLGTATDNWAVDSVWLALGSNGWVPANGTSHWSLPLTLAPGTNMVRAYAVDTSGNHSPTNSATVNYVLTAPLMIVTNGLGTLSPNDAGQSLRVGQNYSITATPANGFKFVNWTNGLTGAVSNSPTLTFTMESNLVLTETFADISRPNVNLTNLISGQRLSNAVFTVKGTASDNWRVGGVSVQLNNSGWMSAAGTTNWSALLTLTPGTNTVQAFSVDNSGNKSLTNSVAIDYVLSAPLTVQIVGAGSVTTNYNGQLLAIGNHYTMTATASNGFAFYFWSWGVQMTTNKTLNFIMASNLVITANFRDVARPTNWITFPIANQKWSNATITVTGKASDNVGVTDVGVQINNSEWVAAGTVNGFTNWTATNLPVIMGTNTIQVYSLDSAGNVSVTNELKFVGELALPVSMVLIPAGSFTLGDVNDTNEAGNENPLTVYVSAFYMDQTDVTYSQWQQVYSWATNHGYSFYDPGSGKSANHPGVDMNWYGCVKWCNARSEMSGVTPAYYTDATQTTVYRTGDLNISNSCVKWRAGYRLPTEAEWEKAARGGLSGQRFPWGNTISESQANYVSYYAYFYDLSDTDYNPTFATGGFPYTSPAGYFAANGYGLYDMAGNVWQWCWDWYGPYAGGSDTPGPASGTYRVVRGGGWSYSAFQCRTADRNEYGPYGNGLNGTIGFRSVLPSVQ